MEGKHFEWRALYSSVCPLLLLKWRNWISHLVSTIFFLTQDLTCSYLSTDRVCKRRQTVLNARRSEARYKTDFIAPSTSKEPTRCSHQTPKHCLTTVTNSLSACSHLLGEGNTSPRAGRQHYGGVICEECTTLIIWHQTPSAAWLAEWTSWPQYLRLVSAC